MTDGLCECGCGQATVISRVTDRYHGWVKGEPRRFLAGHNNRLRRSTVDMEDRGFTTPCHIWKGPKNDRGYGLTCRSGIAGSLAHRIAWIEARGPVPTGLELDHLCRNRDCINPDHLEPVSHKENMVRGCLAKAGDSPIARSRVRLHLSQPDVGKRLGVSSAIVGLWERGLSPVPSQLDVETLTWREPYGADAIAQRRDTVRFLYVEGAPLQEIADFLRVSLGTITSDIKWWREQGEDLPYRNTAFEMAA